MFVLASRPHQTFSTDFNKEEELKQEGSEGRKRNEKFILSYLSYLQSKTLPVFKDISHKNRKGQDYFVLLNHKKEFLTFEKSAYLNRKQ